MGSSVPSRFTVPSFSPWTGEYRALASHCIQSQAASSSQLMPLWLATSWYRGSARSSGPRALPTKAFLTAGGMCWW